MIVMRTIVVVTRDGEKYPVEVEASGEFTLGVAGDIRDAIESLGSVSDDPPTPSVQASQVYDEAED